jgi:hypothetical protein
LVLLGEEVGNRKVCGTGVAGGKKVRDTMFDFDELISLGPAEASRRLRREQDWEALERFGESLLGHSCPMGAGQAGSSNPPVDINGTPFSSWVMWLATSPEGEEFPEAYMMRVQVTKEAMAGTAAPCVSTRHFNLVCRAGPGPLPTHRHPGLSFF